MPHFPSLDPDIRKRLEARGIDPERSADAWLEAIRAGDFPLNTHGLPIPEPRVGRNYHRLVYLRKREVLTPIPLAVVLPGTRPHNAAT